MAYCGPKGIPLSGFLRWAPHDQQAALVWAAREARRCGRCGTHPDDWNEQVGGSRHAYHPENYTCPGCVHVERHAESPDVTHGGRGVHIRLMPGTYAECPTCQHPRKPETNGRVHQRAAIQDRG